jgi:two-component system sensor histidine kinase ChvG
VTAEDTGPSDKAEQGGTGRLGAAWDRVARARRHAADTLIGRETGGGRFIDRLAVRMALINLAGLAVFGVLIVWFGGSQTGLIDERMRALDIHSLIIAGAIAENAVSTPVGVRGEVDIEAANSTLRRLVLPTGYRARLYDVEGRLIADSRTLDSSGAVEMRVIDPPTGLQAFMRRIAYGIDWVLGVIPRGAAPYTEGPNVSYAEVEAALRGEEDEAARRAVRIDDQGDIIISIATPVQRYRAYLGALLLSAEGDDIEAALRAERNVLGRVFLLTVVATVLISLGFAMNVVGPIRRLAREADRVRRAGLAGSGADMPHLPDWPGRNDEIGELGRSLKDMTTALYSRIDAIESFAADVSHEIKNPLTSLRSAVETLELAKNDEAKDRLLRIISDDVSRLDRLITDISDASRLDAELTRESTETVQLAPLLRGLTQIYEDAAHDKNVRVRTEVKTGALPERALMVRGIESRLGQVVQNLLANAISFSPSGGEVRLTARLERDGGLALIVLTVDDDGPGIPEEGLERIFERFYTERPESEAFGKNSGLGLSISRQIITAHGGTIWAENRMDDGGNIKGARFIVTLPAIPLP